MRRRLVLIVLGAIGLLATATTVVAVTGLVDGAEEPGEKSVNEPEQVRGAIFGTVEAEDGTALPDAELTATTAGTDQELGTATSDALGLFDVPVGDHSGPVVLRAEHADGTAATVVPLSQDIAPTGIRLVVGPAGEGTISGQVLRSEDDTPVSADGIVEARFVETSRSEVVAVGDDATYTFDDLPLDGDVILVATLADGSRQGLAASVVAESLTTNDADLRLSPISDEDATEVEDPDIVTEDLNGWTTEGSVTVLSDTPDT